MIASRYNGDVTGERTLGALCRLELDAVALSYNRDPRLVKLIGVNEHIEATARQRYETPTFVRIEPFNDPSDKFID